MRSKKIYISKKNIGSKRRYRKSIGSNINYVRAYKWKWQEYKCENKSWMKGIEKGQERKGNGRKKWRKINQMKAEERKK